MSGTSLIDSQPFFHMDKKLTILPFHNQTSKFPKARPFQHNSSYSLLDKLRPFTERLQIKDGLIPAIKILIGHNFPHLALVSVQLIFKLEEIDIEVSINSIQASKTIRAGYLMGSISSIYIYQLSKSSISSHLQKMHPSTKKYLEI